MPVPDRKNKLGGGVVVLEYGPQAWYLLRDGQQLYLDVNCNYSFVGYSFTMELNSDEAAKYRLHGIAYLDKLAQGVQQSSPCGIGSASSYKPRLVRSHVSEAATIAIKKWWTAMEHP